METPRREQESEERGDDTAARETEAGAFSAPGPLGRDMLDAFGGGVAAPAGDDPLADPLAGGHPTDEEQER